jgi:tetratricopeptide (TPR) repeat protein
MLVVLPLAAGDGGYWPTAWGWAALALFWVAAAGLVLRPDIRMRRMEAGFVAMFVALFGWILASISWSASPTRTILEAERILLYIAGCLAAVVVVRSRSYRALLGGLWGAVSLVCAYSVLTRLFPERLGIVDPIAGYRLSEPLGYWNGLGIFAAIGTLLALGLAARGRRGLVRAGAAASLPVVVLTLYFTFSRGAWVALGVGLLAAIVLDPRRLDVMTATLALAPWPALAVWFASHAEGVTRIDASLAAAASDGRRLAPIVVALAVAASAVSVALTVLERRLRIARPLRRAYAGVLVLLVASALAAVFVRYGPPPTLAVKAYDAFTAAPPRFDPNLNRRLFNLSGGARLEQWSVAWSDYEDHPWLGSGAGSYEQYWLQHRSIAGKVRDAHSLYLETLAELGPVGLGLLVAALGIPALAAVKARRHRLVPAAFGAYVAYLVHAGVDWDWEMPVVTLIALFCGTALLVAARDERTKSISAPFRAVALVAVFVLAASVFVGLVGNSALAASEKAARAGELERAEAEARKAARWAPWSSEAWEQLAEVRFARGAAAAARASLRTAIAKDPRNWNLWYELALQSDTKAAQRVALARARRLNPLSPEIAQFQAARASAAREALRRRE